MVLSETAALFMWRSLRLYAQRLNREAIVKIVICILALTLVSCVSSSKPREIDRSIETTPRSGSCFTEESDVPSGCTDYKDFPEVKGFPIDASCKYKAGGIWQENKYCQVPAGKVGCRESYMGGQVTNWLLSDRFYEDGEPSCSALEKIIK